MADLTLTALTAALADRYRIERELGADGMATPSSQTTLMPTGENR